MFIIQNSYKFLPIEIGDHDAVSNLAKGGKMMFKYLQSKQNPSSKTGLQTTTIFMLAIVGIFSALLLSKIYFTISFFAENPTKTYNYPLISHNDFHRVQETALNDQKLILIFLSTDQCFPCDLMKKQLFEDQSIKDFINKSFIFFEYDEFGMYQNRQNAATALLNNRLPSLLVSDAKGNIQGQISDIFDAKTIQTQLENLLRYSSSKDKKSIDASSNLDIATMYQDFYGIEVDIAYDYYSARQMALEYKYLWNKGVWIQQQPVGHYRIVLGTFSSSLKAQLTKTLIHSLKSVNGKVVKLKMDGEIY